MAHPAMHGIHRSSPRTGRLGATLLLLGIATGGCHDDLLVPEVNRPPIAVARVLGHEGNQVSIDFEGQPLTLTLDASESSDPDGGKLTYRWLSGTAPKSSAPAAGSGAGDGISGEGGAGAEAAGGAGGRASAGDGAGRAARWVPAGEDAAWPDDIERPTVELGEGVFSFGLWVIDDKGTASDPDTLEITIAAPIDPALKSCVDSVLPSVPRSCAGCVCGVSDTCKAAAAMSVCNAECWGLINCIGRNCPNFASGDTACATTQCTSFLAGATGAMMLGTCAAMCATQCRTE